MKYCKTSKTLQISIMVLLPVVIFCNTFANEFLWDDLLLITGNRHIQYYKNIPLLVTPHYWNELHPLIGQYRPVRAVSLAVDFFFWRLNPAGYRITNLLLHAVNVVLIFYLVSIIAGRGVEAQREAGSGWRVFLGFPFLTALFFATHPIHTESINLIKNRSDLLAFLFFLISFLLFIKHFAVSGRTSRRLLILGAWVSFIPAALSKEMALTLPGVLILYAVCFLQGPERKNALIRIAPYGVIIAGYFWFLNAFIKPAESAPPGFPLPAGIGQQALTVIKTMGCYFKMLVIPFPLNLDRTFAVPASVRDLSVLLPLMALLLIIICAIRAYQRSRVVFFSIGWIFLTLLPVVNIFFLWSRPIAEQRLYIPSLGFCLLLGYGFDTLSRCKTRRLNSLWAVIISGLLAGTVVSLYAGMTVRRNFDWRDGITLYSRTLAANPNKARIHNNLGLELSEAGKYDEAIRHYHAALSLKPDYVKVLNNLGSALIETGRADEAIDYYKIAFRFQPDRSKAHFNLGFAFYKAGRHEEAIRHYQTVAKLKPDYPDVHFNLGVVFYDMGRYEDAITQYSILLRMEPNYARAHVNLGLALSAVDRSGEAIRHFLTAISLNPDSTEAHINLGVALADTGRLEEAISHYETVLRLEPDCARAHSNLGAALAKTGRFEEAISHYFDALRLQPDYVVALNNLGLVLVAAGHAEEAVGYYRAALRIVPDNADIFYNLGVAYVKQGDYQKASDFFARSLQVNPEHARARQACRECLVNMKAPIMTRD